MLYGFRKKIPRDDEKLLWTEHAKRKMQYYQLSESRIRRILRGPKRSEKGIVPGTTALMQPAYPENQRDNARLRERSIKRGKRYSEIWVMYQKAKGKKRIITAWRYPGKSPLRDVIPVPEDIRRELEEFFAAQKKNV